MSLGIVACEKKSYTKKVVTEEPVDEMTCQYPSWCLIKYLMGLVSWIVFKAAACLTCTFQPWCKLKIMPPYECCCIKEGWCSIRLFKKNKCCKKEQGTCPVHTVVVDIDNMNVVKCYKVQLGPETA